MCSRPFLGSAAPDPVKHGRTIETQPAASKVDERGEDYLDPARYRWLCSCGASGAWRESRNNTLWGFDRHVAWALSKAPVAPAPEEHW